MMRDHDHRKGISLRLVAAVFLYGIAAVLAVYIGTIAVMPHGAFLTIALFALATYGLWMFFRGRKSDDDEDADFPPI